jgi:hypothetical protein
MGKWLLPIAVLLLLAGFCGIVARAAYLRDLRERDIVELMRKVERSLQAESEKSTP